MIFGFFGGHTLRSLQQRAGIAAAIQDDFFARVEDMHERHDARMEKLHNELNTSIEQAVADRYAAIAELRSEIQTIEGL